MNIFATDPNPIVSAMALDDIRVNKMITESAQMLSSALVRNLVFDNRLYRPAYENHPCTRWAGRTRGNFQWLVDHALALCSIYTMTTGKTHKSQTVIQICDGLVNRIPAGKREEFADCTEFKHRTDLPVVDRYKLQMQAKWQRDVIRLTWTNRKRPEWSIA